MIPGLSNIYYIAAVLNLPKFFSVKGSDFSEVEI